MALFSDSTGVLPGSGERKPLVTMQNMSTVRKIARWACLSSVPTVESQIFVRDLFSYFRTFEKSAKLDVRMKISFRFETLEFQCHFCFAALKSTKISSCKPVSSQTDESL